MEKKLCLCGATITGKPTKIYCCEKCRKTGYKKRKKQKKELNRQKICALCDAPFTSKKRKDALYCSNKCKQKAWRMGD